jgi:hypothetical protein
MKWQVKKPNSKEAENENITRIVVSARSLEVEKLY